MNKDSVDELLESISTRGLRVANLFQFESPGMPDRWRWQANLTDGERFWEFARGATAAEALRAALFTSATTPGEASPNISPQSAPPQPKSPGAIPHSKSPEELGI